MICNEHILPGTRVTVKRRIETEGRIRQCANTFCVLRQYRHHVLVDNSSGTRSCITHAELMQNGIVTQRGVVETP